MSKTPKKSYSDSIKELETLLTELEKNDAIDMDIISAKVKRAGELIAACKKQLHEIDAELEKLLEEL